MRSQSFGSLRTEDTKEPSRWNRLWESDRVADEYATRGGRSRPRDRSRSRERTRDRYGSNDRAHYKRPHSRSRSPPFDKKRRHGSPDFGVRR